MRSPVSPATPTARIAAPWLVRALSASSSVSSSPRSVHACKAEERDAGDDGDPMLIAGEGVTDEVADTDRGEVHQGCGGGDADERVTRR